MTPRALVFKGSVLAHGFVLPPGPASQARILAGWRTGDSVWRSDGQLVWRLATPRRVRCESAPGAPLVLVDGRLLAAPLEKEERPEGGDWVRVSGGEAKACRFETPEVDVAPWLGTLEVEVRAVRALGFPPQPAQRPVLVPSRSGREVLSVGAPVAGAAELTAAIERLRRGVPPPEEPGATAPAAPRPPPQWLVGLMRSLRRAFTPAPVKPSPAPRPKPGAPPPNLTPAVPRPPSALQQLLARLDAWLARQVEKTPVGKALGQRHSDYLDRLKKMFDDGALGDALRHAIPLDDTPSTATGAKPALSVPAPRTSLQVNPLGTKLGPAPQLANDVFQDLKQRYRAAAERLEREGKIDDAAFVLAELLHQSAEAVALLERHGRWKQAAELAALRNLDPALQVRLRLLAGDRAGALALARRHNVYAAVVSHLQSKALGPEADWLRIHWAEHLASSGDFVQAVTVIAPVPRTRHLLARWVELGIAQGGPASAPLVVRALGIGPLPQATERVLEVLNDESETGADLRCRVAKALVDQHAGVGEGALGDAVRAVSRAAVRSLARDAGTQMEQDLFRAKLVDLCGDMALKTDLPPLPRLGPLRSQVTPRRVVVPSADRGTQPVLDAALAADRKVLVALGEAGAQLLGGKGVAARFDVPAHALVIADSGDRALAVAPRGSLVKLARLDLSARTARPWCDARLAAWADSHDGAQWFVLERSPIATASDPGHLTALDLLDDGVSALWWLPDRATHLGRCGTQLAAKVDVADAPAGELFFYDLPATILRRRIGLQPGETLKAIGGGEALVETGTAQGPRLERRGVSGVTQGLVNRGLLRVTPLALGPFWEVVVRDVPEGQLVEVRDQTMGTRLEVLFEGAPKPPRARLQGDAVLLCDDWGRVLVFDLRTGARWKDLRV